MLRFEGGGEYKILNIYAEIRGGGGGGEYKILNIYAEIRGGGGGRYKILTI